MNTYEIVDLDVWGNKKDGFQVNDIYKTGEFITFDSEALTSFEIVELLVNAGFLEGISLDFDMRVEGETDGILFVEIDDEPVFQLHATTTGKEPYNMNDTYEILDSAGASTGRTVEFNFNAHDDDYIVDQVAELEIFPRDIFSMGDLEGDADVLSFVEFDAHNDISDDDLHVFFTLVKVNH